MKITLAFLALGTASLSAVQIGINFLNSDQQATHTIADSAPAGLVPLDGAAWNQFGFNFGQRRNSLNAPLVDSRGNTAATLDFDLNQSYVGNNSAVATEPDDAGSLSMMASYISWDPVDGTTPEDSGQIAITGLGSDFTTPGYDVYVYFDADVNTRTFTFTLNGTASTPAADSSTWNGTFRETSLFPTDGNVAVFRNLTASDLVLLADSNSGRAAVNAIQIVSQDHPGFDAVRIAFHNGVTTIAAMNPAATPTAAGEVVDPSREVWNDVANNGGLGLTFSGFALTSSHGLATGATLAASAGYSGFNNNGWDSATKDHVMMEGWYGLIGSESLTIADLPPSVTSGGYHVVVYGDSDITSRSMVYTIDDSSGPQTATIQDSGTFAGTFSEGSHFVVFTGLSGSAFTLTGNATGFRSAVNGIEIIAGNPVDLPVIATFAADDQYVSPGTTVTLSWDAPTFDTLTLDLGGIDAAALSTGGIGSYALPVTETSTFKLTATLGEESVERTLRISTGPPRPNLVVFLLDDFGPHDLSVPFNLDALGNPASYQFNQFYQTPHMESLAASGMRFTSAYAQSVCSPTRCGLMTGRNSARHAVTDWVGGGGAGSPTNWRTAGITGAEDITLPALLSGAGYRTMHVGKAHFSNSATPVTDLGFDENVAGFHWGHPFSGYLGAPAYGGMPGMEAYDGSIFLTRALSIEANRLLTEATGDGVPFFLNMSFYAVHSPFTENPDATGDYSGAVNTNHRNFATMVEGVDRAIGSIRQKLVDLGVAENTLIVFLGDNGSDSPATTVDGLPSGTFSDFPMRGKKGSKWEGGTRVPLIACWAAADPGNPFQQALPIPANSIETDIVTSWDVPVTLLGVAGVPGAPDFGEDGHDLSAYLAGQPGSHRPQELVVHYPHNHRSDFFSWIRQGGLKLIYNYQANSWQLYDLVSDPTESNDLAASQPETVTRLARALAQRLAASWGTRGPLIPTATTSARNGNVVSIPDNPAVDVDADGLPDNAEDPDLDGLVDPGETDPDSDNSDGDNLNDGDELRTGTDPLDGNSFFYLRPEVSSDAFIIRWPSDPGATYRIEHSDTLADGDWTPLEESHPADAGSETTYPLGTPTSTRMFYRVKLN